MRVFESCLGSSVSIMVNGLQPVLLFQFLVRFVLILGLLGSVRLMSSKGVCMGKESLFEIDAVSWVVKEALIKHTRPSKRHPTQA